MKTQRALALLQKSLKDPYNALYYLLYGEKKNRVRCRVKLMMKLTGASHNEVLYQYESFNEEEKDFDIDPINNKKFHESLSTKINEGSFGGLDGTKDLYVMVSILKPDIVVETGVSAGLSSAYILKALNDNHKGILYSIDLPNRNFTDYLSESVITNLTNRVGPLETLTPLPKKGPGFLIPEYLKRRWVLKIGESKQLLPKLLKDIRKVDIFLHDSEHSYKNMMFEFSTVWNCLTDKGLLLSHDTNWNDSFKDFSRKVNRKPINLTFSGLKAIKK